MVKCCAANVIEESQISNVVVVSSRLSQRIKAGLDFVYTEFSVTIVDALQEVATVFISGHGSNRGVIGLAWIAVRVP